MHFDYIQEMSHSGPLTININGPCMGDSLPDGCDVTIIRKSLYWPGDIIILGRRDGQLFGHRFLGYVLGRRGWKAITIADSETLPDATTPADRILGKVVRIDGEIPPRQPLQRIKAIIMFFRVLPRTILANLARSG